MTKYVESESLNLVALDDAETKLVERYFIIAAFAALISGLTMPSTGMLGAMLVTFCCMVPMAQQFWATKRAAALGMGAIACVIQAPAIYWLAMLVSFMAKKLLS